MINSVQIQNFKSVVDLKLELGQFNVLIGENGCGKSNILEAMAFGGAASANKLDYEFLGSRGIRVTNPKHIFSAFGKRPKKNIFIVNFFTNNKPDVICTITNDYQNPKKWIDLSKSYASNILPKIFDAVMFETDKQKKEKVYKEFRINENDFREIKEAFTPILKTDKDKERFKKLIYPRFVQDFMSSPIISNFIVYSPEESKLRKFEETTQIYPLGIKGEGLFQYLKDLALDKKTRDSFKEINENLTLLDWFENLKLPDKLLRNEYSLKIKDRYLYKSLQYFDQNSTNEGFLFLLFYTTLFISKLTPSFFAIDNIDSSFNPKLCIEITRNLSRLATEHKKQVIVTTHNPSILDGLNLEDNTQRLFVVRRNLEGHTTATRVEYNPERKMKLSEIWTKGFIGGLPENF